MKLFAFADLHSKPSFDEQAFKKADVRIFCGDFCVFGRGLKEVAEAIGRVENFLFVPGNNETPKQLLNYCKEYGWIDLHGKRVQIGGWNFIGCGGSTPTPFNTPFELTESEMERILKRFEGIKQAILVTHHPPYGALDKVIGEKTGSRAIRDFILKQKPAYCFCGHVHEYARNKVKLGSTTVINPGRRGILIEI